VVLSDWHPVQQLRMVSSFVHVNQHLCFPATANRSRCALHSFVQISGSFRLTQCIEPEEFADWGFWHETVLGNFSELFTSHGSLVSFFGSEPPQPHVYGFAQTHHVFMIEILKSSEVEFSWSFFLEAYFVNRWQRDARQRRIFFYSFWLNLLYIASSTIWNVGRLSIM
jgi:hypothetical protein